MKLLIMLGIAAIATFPSFMASANTCADRGDSITQSVCQGDWVRSQTNPQIRGKVVEIDQEAYRLDNRQPIYFKIQEMSARGDVLTDGRRLQLTNDDYALITPNTCLQNNEERSICVDEVFKSSDNGRLHKIVGFTADGVLLSTEGRDFEIVRDPSYIYESRKVAETGIMNVTASCGAEIFRFGLNKCAKKKVLKKLNNKCNTYCSNRGSLEIKDANSNQGATCEMKYNLFPPHKKVCTSSLEGTCTCDSGSPDTSSDTITGESGS